MMNTPRSNRALLAALLMTFLAPLSACLGATADAPPTTPEGMELVKQTKSRVVYAMPGATLSGYGRVALLDCYVAFEKNWKRDYNRDATFERRIDDADMERIRADLAEEFRKVFTEALTEAGHEVVDGAAPDVLIVRPAIVDLEVTAPDVRSAGMDRVIVDSAGSMTLFMELYDSTTGAIIARIMDAQADDPAFAQRADPGGNRMAADRILASWARELAAHLGDVREDGLAPAAD